MTIAVDDYAEAVPDGDTAVSFSLDGARGAPQNGEIVGPVGKVRKPIAVLIFSIITIGIYQLYWTYQVFRELKEHTGQGVGGPIGLVIGLLIGVVNLFLMPAEIGNMYAAEGQPKPVTGVTGLWNLLPLVGTIVWYFKVQGALNRHWESHGAAA